ncbi:MAG: squalene--hopene cyclase [Gammaproteobacteria bacterium]
MNNNPQSVFEADLIDTPAATAQLRWDATVQPLELAVSRVTEAINKAGAKLLERQDGLGYWRFDLEADTTIPSEYIMFQHFMGTVNLERHRRMVRYILSRQQPSGAWPLYENGPGDISATVKAYLALKVTGESPQSEPMTRAREWILANGGAERVNVFTRILLAMFGQIPWHVPPAMPIEMLLLPRWFFFHMSKVSYWSRCVIIPLLILYAMRPVHRLAPEHDIAELFHGDPKRLGQLDAFTWPGSLAALIRNGFVALDRVLKFVEPRIPRFIRSRALRRAQDWTREHMRGSGGIGAIYPAMANAVMALKLLGARPDDPDLVRGTQAIEDLVLDGAELAYCQPCVSPVWDTCLSLNALLEAGISPADERVRTAVRWLFDNQVFVKGDWADRAPGLDGGGWSFQFENDQYPDLDDTSMVLMALLRARAYEHPLYRRRISMAVNWVLGMQNSDGGWAAFDIDNHYEYLNFIPFADHGALVDPSTSDLTGRCIEVLAMLGHDKRYPPIARALEFLRSEQEDNGAWFGRWGVNYIYGTWSVLHALGALGEDPNEPYIRKAVAWLKSVQNADGGWGEGCNSYDDPALQATGRSTASQTAWALLGLMAVGEVQSDMVERGVQYLLRTRRENGSWDEPDFTGTGFPRVFYLRYHGYCHYFPLWALGVYRRLHHGLQTAQHTIIDEGAIDLDPLPLIARYRFA